MSIIGSYWKKICEPLDGFLWHKDISHPIIRPLLRNEILACGFILLLGGVLFAIFPWLFWFGTGMLCMCWIFWSWARFFLRYEIGEYSSAFLRSVLFRFGLRLLLLAIGFYFILAVFHAPASALLAGLITGLLLGLASYAWQLAWTARH